MLMLDINIQMYLSIKKNKTSEYLKKEKTKGS